MSPLIASLLALVAGIIGFVAGWLSRKHGAVINFVSYDCQSRDLVVNVSHESVHKVFAYGLDNSAGGASVPDVPPSDVAMVDGDEGDQTLSSVPHENDASKIKLCVWAVNFHIERDIDCSGSASSSTEDAAQGVLP